MIMFFWSTTLDTIFIIGNELVTRLSAPRVRIDVEKLRTLFNTSKI